MVTQRSKRPAQSPAQAILEIRRDGTCEGLWVTSEALGARFRGKRLDEALSRELAEAFRQNMERSLATGALVSFSAPLGEDGAGTLMDVAMAPRGSDGVVCVMRDATEVEALRAHAAFQERLASMGMVAAGIAHEINNSLTILIASLESLGMLVAAQTAASGGGEATKLVADARAGAARIASIVRDLSGFTRADGAPGPVDLRAVLGSCVRMLRAQVRPRARLVVTEGPVPAIMGTEARLSQVVFNLLLNAAQAVPEGRPDENQIHVSLSARDGNVVLAVSDTGVGIAEGERERVFEPFYTTKAHGTGLGLFVTRSIVEEFGGAVRVSENTPRGATFTVTFPSSNESPRARRRTTPRGMARGRVLIVDDEPLIAQSLARLLRPLASISADGAERALEIFEGDREFDLVLCDLMMPGKSGIDLFEAARARWPELEERFVFMTGGVYTERAREFVARVDNTLLEKPITKEALLSVITRIGRE